MFAVQGGIYLLIKTEGELHDRIRRAVPRLMIAFFVLNTLVVVAWCCSTRHLGRVSRRHLAGPPPAAALVALGAPGCSSGGRAVPRLPALVRDDRLLLISGGVGLYPNLIISTIDRPTT
jgi:cytochrome bd-type quinol oxidase subunit 2